MVVFEEDEVARRVQATIDSLRAELRIKPEFKFNRCKAEYRDRFFSEIEGYEFYTRAVVVKKRLIYSEALRTKKESFYKFFIRQMIEKSQDGLVDARIVIDGSGDRTFKREFKSYLTSRLDPSCVKKVSLKDSRSDALVQLADMTAGAIARSYRTDRSDSNRWRAQLKRNGQLQSVWDFM